MKLLFKPIKVLLGIVISILIIPAIFLALLWKPVSPPENYSDQSLTIESSVTESIDTFMAEDEATRSPLTFGLNAQTINTELRNQLLSQVESYNDQYLMVEGPVMIQGVWVEMKKEAIDITLGVHVDANVMIFKSRVLLRFEIIDTEGVINLKLKKINIGNLPLAWASGIANTVFKQFMNQDLETMLQEQIGDIGEFNLKERSLKIDLRKAAENLEENSDLAIALIDLVYSEELFSLGINKVGEEYLIGVELSLNKLEDTTPHQTISQAERINNENELEVFLASKIDMDESKIISTLLSTSPEFRLNGSDLNIVLDYFMRGSTEIGPDGIFQTMELYAGYDFNVYLPYIDIKDSLAEINLPFDLTSPNEDVFMSTIKFKTNLTVSGSDLVLNIQSVTVGDLIIDAELLNELLALMPSSEAMLQGNSIVFKDFVESFNQQGLSFDDLVLDNNQIVLVYSISQVDQALNEVLNDPNISEGTKDLIETLVTDPHDEQAINDLLDHIETLDETEKQALFDAINEALEGLDQIPLP